MHATLDTDQELPDQMENGQGQGSLLPPAPTSPHPRLYVPTAGAENTHLEFNTRHLIVKFIWIFFQSLLSESPEVFLFFVVVTEKQVKNGLLKENSNKQKPLEAGLSSHHMRPRRPEQHLTECAPHSTVTGLDFPTSLKSTCPHPTDFGASDSTTDTTQSRD